MFYRQYALYALTSCIASLLGCDLMLSFLISFLLIPYANLIKAEDGLSKESKEKEPSFHSSVTKFIFYFLKTDLHYFIFLSISSIVQYHSTILYSFLFQNALQNAQVSFNKIAGIREILPYFAKYLIAPFLLSLSFGSYCLLFGHFISRLTERIRGYFFNFILGNSYFYFSQTPTGTISSRVNSITASSVKIVQYLFSELIPTTSLICTTLFILLRYDTSLIKIITLWIFVHISIYLFRLPKYISLSIENAKFFSNLNGVVVDIINNVLALKIFNSVKVENMFFNKAQKVDIDSYRKVLLYEKKTLVMMDAISYMPILTIFLIYNLFKLHLAGIMSIGEAMVAFNSVRSMSGQLWKATSMLGDILIDFSRCRDALQILTLPKRVVDEYPDNHLKTENYNGSVEFININFVYSSVENKEEVLLFDNFNLKIQPKSKVALVGPSGSGKSTIVSLLTRINEPNKGIIKINEQNIKTVSRESLANVISFISQNPLLFQRTIFENIGYGCVQFRDFILKQGLSAKSQFHKLPTNLQEIILDSAKKAEAHEFIINLPNGYDSVYGNEINLSGGQKQRLMIARAFASQEAQIMILDEATSALDAGKDSIIKHVIEQMDITIIMVAHKLNIIKNFDRIIVFEEGRIVEEGTHEELIAKSGKYYTLWNAQFN